MDISCPFHSSISAQAPQHPVQSDRIVIEVVDGIHLSVNLEGEEGGLGARGRRLRPKLTDSYVLI